MSKFINAVSKGLSAANVVDKYKKEIKEVLMDADAAVRNATSHKVSLLLSNDVASEKDEFIKNIAIFLNKEKVTFLVLQNLIYPTVSVQKIAVWNQSSNGYPCRIQIGEQELICTNRASLEDVLAEILSKPSFGRSLLSVQNAKPKVKAEHIAVSGISGEVVAKKSATVRKIPGVNVSISAGPKRRSSAIKAAVTKAEVASTKKRTVKKN